MSRLFDIDVTALDTSKVLHVVVKEAMTSDDYTELSDNLINILPDGSRFFITPESIEVEQMGRPSVIVFRDMLNDFLGNDNDLS